MKPLRSLCCNAPLEIQGETTRHFVCHDCGEPTDPKPEADTTSDQYKSALVLALECVISGERRADRAIAERDEWRACADELFHAFRKATADTCLNFREEKALAQFEKLKGKQS